MMCGCGQDVGMTHLCPLLQGPTCWCGKPLWQTHVHWGPVPSATWPTPYTVPTTVPGSQPIVVPDLRFFSESPTTH